MLDQYKRVQAYDIPSAVCDGQDIETVIAASQVAVDHVRNERKPYFLELKTYRFRGHSMSDGGKYRTKEEQAEWKKRDPIRILRDRLTASDALTDQSYKTMDREVMREIEEVVVPFAENSPEPDVADVAKYVLATGDPWVRGGSV